MQLSTDPAWPERFTLAEDIDNVMSNASPITRSEEPDIEVMKADLAAGIAVTMLQDNHPCTILGHIDLPPGRLFWFITRQQFFDFGLRGIRYTREHLSRVRAAWPGKSFTSYSQSAHPAMAKWFKAIGFIELPSELAGLSKFRMENLDV